MSGFASGVVIRAANNGGNILKGVKESTSKKALRSLGKDMLAAGVITGVMNGTGFGDVAEKAKDVGVTGRNQAIFERMMLRTGVNTAIKGGSLRDNFMGEVLRGALAVGQGYIGDIGQRYGLSEERAAKVMMHSALGGTYALARKGNVAIGMLAGGMGEALSGLTSSPAHKFSGTGESGTGLSNWNDTIVAATAMLAGASASDMQMATSISSSVVEYNAALHLFQQQALMTQALLSTSTAVIGDREKVDAEPLLPDISLPSISDVPIVLSNMFNSLAEKLNSLGIIDNETASSAKIGTIISLLATNNLQIGADSAILEKSKHGNKGNNNSKANPQSQEKAVAASGSMKPDFEPDKDKNQKEKQLAKDGKKYEIKDNNVTGRKVLESLDKTAREFVSEHRKGNIREEFPGEYWDKTLREILNDANNRVDAARTAKKLLIKKDFLK
ncbi:DUF637 domain-containing protein [Rickettsia endosymbiont of Rhinocyllus conicus]|uniref:DUF637 domain-containing protein n=1 Tax=Rickettsia endosymbiont of Rhinocyllus conicus TaxID=3066252 RepID=UPI003132CDDD